MSTFKNILQSVADHGLHAGGDQTHELTVKLQAYRQQQLIIFVFFELFLVVGVAVCAYYLTHSPAQSAQIKVLAGIIGIGTGGGIEVMRRIWKEWSRTDLTLVLIQNATPAQVKTLIDKLIKDL